MIQEKNPEDLTVFSRNVHIKGHRVPQGFFLVIKGSIRVLFCFYKGIHN